MKCTHSAQMLTLLFCLCHTACGGCDGRPFDSTYDRYYSKKELIEKLQEVPTSYTVVDQDRNTLTIELTFNTDQIDYVDRGFTDPPIYKNDNSLATNASPQRPSHPIFMATQALGYWIAPAHAAIEPNSGNAIALTADLTLTLTSPSGDSIIDEMFIRAPMEYGAGVYDWSEDPTRAYEYIVIQSGTGAPATLQLIFESLEGEAFALRPLDVVNLPLFDDGDGVTYMYLGDPPAESNSPQ